MRGWVAIVAMGFLAQSCAGAGGTGGGKGLEVRGMIAGALPVYGGGGATAFYWGDWKKNYEAVDAGGDHPWFRAEYRRERFERWQREGYNAILFLHPHPYPALVDVPGFPEAAALTPEQLGRNRTWFRALLSEAKERGLSVYILTWSIFLPGTFAKAHGLPESGQVFDAAGVDTPLTRAYTAAAVRALFETYPDLAGLVPTPGESPVPCVEFTRQAICDPVAALKPQPRLLIRDQGIYPHEFEMLSKGLTNWNPFCKAQEEQFFIDEVSNRVTLFQNATGKPAVTLATQTPHWLFFGDWRFIQRLCADLKRKGTAGVFMETGDGGINWITEQALGRYLADPSRPEREEEKHWETLVRERYGDVPARDFLAAAQASSGIVPAVGRAFYYRNNNYKPQVGLPLNSLLGMPTISSYRHTGINRPDLEREFSWRVARKDRWTRDWLTIHEYAANPDAARPGKAIGPLETADDLARRARDTRRLLAALTAAQPERNAEEYRRIVDLMELAARLGDHYAAKMRAAVACQGWLAGKGDDSAWQQVNVLLAGSVDHYRVATGMMERLYGPGAPQGRIRIATMNQQPPWQVKGMQSFEGEIVGGMREMLRLFEIERDLVARRTAAGDRRVPTFKELVEAARG